MTKEEKDLLIKDLCARLPYGVVCDMWFAGNPEDKITEELKCGGLMRLMNEDFDFIAKPYLRPMDSMTEDEKTEYIDFFEGQPFCPDPVGLIEWLTANFFDYNYLIDDDLAIEVTKENNPYKGK